MQQTTLTLLVVLLSAAPAGALTARVDPAGGAPRIVVDGQPVRPRMFWGAPGGGRLAIGTEATQQFEFQAADTAANATLHFRFGAEAGEVRLDDVRLVDVASGSTIFQSDFGDGMTPWRAWPANHQDVAELAVGGENPALRATIKKGADQRGFHIYSRSFSLQKGQRYRVSFKASADPPRHLLPAVYRPGEPYTFLGGPPGHFETQIRMAAEAGADFVSFPVGLPWPAPGKQPDWDAVDAACRRVLEANPRALMIPRVPCNPPRWWREAHPDDTMQWENGRRDFAAVASPRYRRDVAERLAAFVEHCEARFGDRIAGYHPSGQNTGEWFYEDTWKPALSGYAPAELTAWRAWLAARYPTDAALQTAWNDPAAARATAALPLPQARRTAAGGVLRHPARERLLLDFAQFQQESMADCVCQLARAVRQATKGQKLVVFFYGYVFEFAAVHNGPAIAGHYGLRRALQSPDIDILCSPISYFDRGLGESAPSMTAAESIALAGKMWLNEDDTSTYLSTGSPPGSRERVATVEQSNTQLVRNTAQAALRNFACWWMDLGASGWFSDRRMWAEMERLVPLDRAMIDRPRPFRPQVAAVIDEQAMTHVAHAGDALTRPAVYEVRRPLARMGAPYGQYLADDVAAGRVDARLYVFLTPWRMDAAERAAVLRHTRGRGKVWCFAPGLFDPSPAAAARELTGFELRPSTSKTARCEPTAAGRAAGIREGFGLPRPLTPLLAAADARPDEVLAVYDDGSAAVALRQTADGPSLFVGPPGLTSDLLRAVARRAGVHLFTATDCNVYANGPYVVLHGAVDGKVRLNLGGRASLLDFYTRQAVGHGPDVELPLKFGETRVLELAD